GLSRACLPCHTDQHQGQLSADCLTCHTMTAWKPAARFDHERSAFPLQGKHAQVECAKCHQQGKYKGLPFQQCRDCHQDTHRPSLGNDCQRCHTVAGWKGASQVFDHERSAFPLRGQHAQVECVRCHQQGRFKGLPFQQCRDCHQDPHRPSLGNDCQRCHTVGGWKGASQVFDHEHSAFPLRGQHAQVECAKCHLQGKYKGLPFQQCRDCHQDYHQGQFTQDCAGCHVVEGWKPAALFDHGKSAFPLQGKHLQVECAKCHQQGHYRPLAQQCRDCHQDVHQGQFAQDCALCHVVEDWKPATLFDHQRATYQLDGAHVVVQCEQCHLLEQSAGKDFRRYRPVPATCQACHG
ncbi:MAG: DUF3716 domain-containing protein, partial [Candidatus Latescibacteria bacterium]|nr:DUF3716 domain-containing protein [Candidatus Latescibacterota bacterium]